MNPDHPLYTVLQAALPIARESKRFVIDHEKMAEDEAYAAQKGQIMSIKSTIKKIKSHGKDQ